MCSLCIFLLILQEKYDENLIEVYAHGRQVEKIKS